MSIKNAYYLSLLLDRFYNSAIVDEKRVPKLKDICIKSSDIISSGLDLEKIQQSDLWWLGPSFLELEDWRQFVNEVILDHVETTSEKMGGEGKVVEIDESKFGKRKYNRGHAVKRKKRWVFGGIERGSDNGTNFVGSNSELKNLDWDKIMKETDIKPIKWKFNPPTAAWWGGWWERLVRVIKELLKRTLGKAILTYEELLTILCDCEAVVNSRPLTYVSEDPNDLIPLTPSLFLNGKSSYDTIDLDLSEFSKFQNRIKYRRKLIHHFRSRFRKEYLGQLRQKRPGKPGHDFKVGDVVMIEESSKKRVYWPLGKVISLLPGRNGKVRTLKLKCKNSELIRPIQRVYPLEVPFINNEIVTIDGVPTPSVNEDKLTSNAVIKNKVTRSGRLVKIPERLGLFNEVLYAFE
ncbi:integrase catalytic domain-containing protein [Trichonephila clavipes]|uniref:Integrase catalytic domain-containing protein n=1 Tax=Trichonephila clavipes TaxID=2585209 RepID=A0A8X6VV70_TRICX|nr:integrase catalytic domain-containing protein [Trichonephila clavipes]